VRDPFFEMVKMSMATFINAMTGYDCTYYPVASNVPRDLFNLADVYFDAVFRPLLTEEIFRREGHHLVPADRGHPAAGLSVSGIVYNEMKGWFSNPELTLAERVTQNLMPDTIYGRNSGGRPERIPDLRYEQFVRYHRSHYHPSNAFFFLYGNIPTAEHLVFLRERLATFRREPEGNAVARQPRWAGPREVREPYPISQEEPADNKTYAALAWIVGDVLDPQDATLWHILGQILLGNEAAPLRQAVIDSRLGQDLIHSGADWVGRESVFRVGLKGTDPGLTGAFEGLVLDTLRRLAGGRIERSRVDAAFHQVSYHFLEIRPELPLFYLSLVLDSWRFGGDPLMFLRMQQHLSDARARYESDPALFNAMLRERLLTNPHRLLLVLEPDREWQARTDAEFARRMENIRRRLNDGDLRRIAREAEDLERASAAPNPPEALARLPQLGVRDLPRKPVHIPTAVETLDGGVVFLHNDVFANGVNYLALDFDLEGLPADLWPYLPRYADAVVKMGAAGLSYEEIAARLAANTGGIGCRAYFQTHAADPARSLKRLRVALKALDDRMDSALDVLRDVLFGVNPRDSARLENIVSQSLADCRTQIVQEGTRTAELHAGRGLSPEAFLSEAVEGLPQLPLVRMLHDAYRDQSAGLMDRIEAIRDFVLNRRRMTVSFTGSDAACARAREAARGWAAAMRDEAPRPADTGFRPFPRPVREGLAGQVQVAFCARVIPAPHSSHEDEPLLVIGSRLVSMDYLLSEIRFKGNAYGGGCGYDGLQRKWAFWSYRDPRVAETLEVFEGVRRHVESAPWRQADVDRAIIGTAKHEQRPIRPASATDTALWRHVAGLTPERREQRYERLLAATPEAVRGAVLAVLDRESDRGSVCVVAGRPQLEEANRRMPGRELEIRDIE
jgi:Zn-dependent M16 (insulinase) family peptidase